MPILFAFSMACVRRFTSSFSNKLEQWVLIVFSDKNNWSAISWLLNPLDINSSTSHSLLLIPVFRSARSSGINPGTGAVINISRSTIWVWIFGFVSLRVSQIPRLVKMRAIAPIYTSKLWSRITNRSSSQLSRNNKAARAAPYKRMSLLEEKELPMK